MRVKDFKDDRFKTKIAELFSFISQPDHRIYNRELQKRYLSQILVYSATSEKVMNHLYLTVNTQSQPKINKLADFFEEFNRPDASLKSYRDFTELLKCQNFETNEATYADVFDKLREKEGWGPKTAALFVKELMLLHLPKPIGLFETPAIWVDAPRTLPNKVYLPVDSVILSVFRKLSDPFVKKPLNWDFNNVNAFLMERCGYNSEDMLVWDDLWFWGYFNQHVDKPGRRHEWNPAKYWANREADKNKIESVEQLSKLYLNIVGSDN